MGILFNKKLRELKKKCINQGYNFPDFYYSKELLNQFNLINDYEIIDFLNSLYTGGITNKEDFLFFLEIYKNNDIYYSDVLFNYNNITIIKKLYYNNKKILKKLIAYPNLLNDNFIEVYGNDFILNNDLYIFDKYDLDFIISYSEYIKKSPNDIDNIFYVSKIKNKEIKAMLLHKISNFDYKIPESTLKRLEKISDKNILNNLLNFLEKKNFDNILTAIEKNPYLSNVIVNNCDNDILLKKLSIGMDYSCFLNKFYMFNDFRDVAPNIVSEIFIEIEKYLYESKDLLKLKDFVYKSLINSIQTINKEIILQLKYYEENGLAISDDVRLSLNLYYKLEKITDIDELNALFNEHFLKKDLNLDSQYLMKLYAFNQAELMKKSLTNIDDFPIVDKIDYEYTDSNGNKISKKIEVREIDDPDFNILIHNITKNDGLYGDFLTEFSKTNEIYNPENWFKKIMKGNQNISMYNANSRLRGFGVGTIKLGFNDYADERYISYSPYDGNRSSTIKSNNYEVSFRTLNDYKEGRMDLYRYDEHLFSRYYNGKSLNYNYVLYYGGSDLELTKEWAAYNNVPILRINVEKIREKRIARIKSLVNKIIKEKNIEPNSFKIFGKDLAYLDFNDEASEVEFDRFKILYDVYNSVYHNRQNLEYIITIMDNIGMNIADINHPYTLFNDKEMFKNNPELFKIEFQKRLKIMKSIYKEYEMLIQKEKLNDFNSERVQRETQNGADIMEMPGKSMNKINEEETSHGMRR